MQESEVGRQVVSYVGEFILGGIAIFAIAIAYWAIRELKRAHDKHVADLKSAKDELIKVQNDSRKSNALVVGAIEKLTTTVSVQTTAIQENTRASAEVKSAIDSLKGVVDSVIRDAVRSHVKVAADQPPGPG